MILLDCDRNSTNTNIFRSPVQQIVRNQSILRTTVFYKPFFELSVMRGNFFRWAGFGDIPSSHGDIPVVSFLTYEVESTKHIFLGFLDFSTLWKLFQCLLQVSKMQVFACTFYKIGFSFDANTQFLLGFVDAVELVSIYKLSFPFSAIQWTRVADCNYPTNTVPDKFQLVCFNGSGKRMLILFERSYVINKGTTSL